MHFAEARRAAEADEAEKDWRGMSDSKRLDRAAPSAADPYQMKPRREDEPLQRGGGGALRAAARRSRELPAEAAPVPASKADAQLTAQLTAAAKAFATGDENGGGQAHEPRPPPPPLPAKPIGAAEPSPRERRVQQAKQNAPGSVAQQRRRESQAGQSRVEDDGGNTPRLPPLPEGHHSAVLGAGGSQAVTPPWGVVE